MDDFNESFPHGLLSITAAALHDVKDLRHDLSYTLADDSQLRPDISFVLDGVCVIVEMKYDAKDEGVEALLEAMYYRKVLEERVKNKEIDVDVKRFLYFGVNVARNKKVTVKFEQEDGTCPRPVEIETPEKVKKNKTHPK